RVSACFTTVKRIRPSAGPWRVTALQYPHVQPAAVSLPPTISQYFIGDITADSTDPVQQSQTIIEIRPFRGGWQCFEAPQTAFLLYGGIPEEEQWVMCQNQK